MTTSIITVLTLWCADFASLVLTFHCIPICERRRPGGNSECCGVCDAVDSDILTLLQDIKPKTLFGGRRYAKFLQGVNDAGVIPRRQGIEGLLVLNGA